MKTYRRNRQHLIKDRLMVYAVFFIVPIILFLIGSNIYATYLLRRQVASSDENTVKLYAEKIDKNLSGIKNYLISLGDSLAMKQLAAARDYDQKMLAAYQIKNEFQEGFSLYDGVIDGLFVYEPSDEIYMKKTAVVDTIKELEEIETQIKKIIEEDTELQKQIVAKWFDVRIGTHYYLLRIYHTHGVYYGSWSNLERMLEKVITIPIENAENVLILTKEKEPLTIEERYYSKDIEWRDHFSEYYLTGTDDRYLVIGEPIEEGEYFFVAMILDQNIHKGAWLFTGFMVVLIGISVLLLWLFIRYSKKEIAVPLERVVNVMEKAETGDLDVVLPEESHTKEFGILNVSFNKMLKEIKHLKIKVYEEKIQKQKAQLDFLQIQTNPHFFINAMNVVYNYARLNNMEMVKNMTLSLVKHFRYTLYGETWVFLEEEVEFIQNYLHLQKLRTANMSNIEIEIEIPQELMKERIPIMIIQPFVENSIKYGESEKEVLKILVEAAKENDILQICIRDNGEGFENEILEALNQGKQVIREEKKRIGIQNVRSRLSILYGEEAHLSFRNGECGGAIVEIKISKTACVRRNRLEEKNERINY